MNGGSCSVATKVGSSPPSPLLSEPPRLQERFDDRWLYVSSIWGGKRPRGFEERDGDRDNPPTGLRYNKREGFLTPNLRSKAGKALRDEMESIRFERPTLPGMPAMVFAGSHVNSPAMQLIDGSVWAGWGCAESYLMGEADFLAERLGRLP